MNKKITAALLLTLPCLAYAQTPSPDKLVVYGALDAGFQYQSLKYHTTGQFVQGAVSITENGKTQTDHIVDIGTPVNIVRKINRFQQQDGFLLANRLGVFGAHKLADRFYTIFNLETGFNLKDGSLKKEGVLFSRRAFLGLQGVFGRITLGNQPDAVNQLLGPDPFGNPGLALYYDLFGSTVGTVHPKSVLYLTPEYKGVQLGASFNTKDKTATQPKEHSYAVAGHYKQDNFSISTGYIHNNRTHHSSWVINGTVKVSDVTLYARYARANMYQSTFINRVFCLGKTGLDDCDQIALPFVDPRVKVWSLGAKIPVSQTGDLVLSFQQGHEKSHKNGSSRANFYRVAYKEQLSKQTFVYGYAGFFQGKYTGVTLLPTPKKGGYQYANQKTTLNGYGVGIGLAHTFKF